MPVVPFDELFEQAEAGGYALGYFESWSLESLQAVIEAAEETGSPVIAGFNGGFLRHEARGKPERLEYYAGLRFALQAATVPVGFLLNESDDLDQMRRAVDLGFNGVMPECEGLEPDAYRALVQQVVEYARPRGVFVEAQVGRLSDASSYGDGHGRITDPDEARRFVEQTGIDALAVAVGNVHILTQGTASVEMDALRRIHEKVRTPLVLHGGTGIAREQIPELIRLGVRKVNFGTNLKQAYLEAVRKRLSAYREPMSPHPFLGMGGPQDVLAGGREAVRQVVLDYMEILQSVKTVSR